MRGFSGAYGTKKGFSGFGNPPKQGLEGAEASEARRGSTRTDSSANTLKAKDIAERLKAKAAPGRLWKEHTEPRSRTTLLKHKEAHHRTDEGEARKQKTNFLLELLNKRSEVGPAGASKQLVASRQPYYDKGAAEAYAAQRRTSLGVHNPAPADGPADRTRTATFARTPAS